MQQILLGRLLTEWANRLGSSIEDLDTNLPIERKYEISHRYIGHGDNPFSFNFNPKINLETHPELYQESKRSLPLVELSGLRDLLDDINSLIEDLRTPQRDTEEAA